MRRFLLLLLLLIQLNKSRFVKAKEDVISPEKSEKSEKEEKKGENGKKDKDEEDSCLSSPCGSHARCKNVEVKCLWDIVHVHIQGLKKSSTNWFGADIQVQCFGGSCRCMQECAGLLDGQS